MLNLLSELNLSPGLSLFHSAEKENKKRKNNLRRGGGQIVKDVSLKVGWLKLELAGISKLGMFYYIDQPYNLSFSFLVG